MMGMKSRVAVRRTLTHTAVLAAVLAAPAWRVSRTPRFVELPCSEFWGSFDDVPRGSARCGTVTVSQDRSAPNDSRLVSVVLPVVVYSLPGAHGTPVVVLTGGPGESSIETVQRVFLRTPTGGLMFRERPIIAIERRGYSPVTGRASPSLGTYAFERHANRELSVAPLVDSLTRRARDLRAHGIDPRNFTTIPTVDDVADVLRALGYDKSILFGISYGTREALQFMRRHPTMVEAAVLDGVAPPDASQLLDAGFVAKKGRDVVKQIVADCRADSGCAAQFSDLPRATDDLARDSSVFRRTARFTSAGAWRTLEIKGPSLLAVLGVAAASDEIRANIPRMIVDFAAHDTVSEDLSTRVLVAAASDPSLQFATRGVIPLVYSTVLCADRPQGEPMAGDRRICDALGVPFSGNEQIAPVTSNVPTLLISSGYDSQTPAEFADEAAKTLPRSRRVNFPMTGHVAFPRPVVAACAAVLIEAFLRNPDYPLDSDCAGNLMPVFTPRTPDK
jgi:pimeloyl-ACP methyl ester carboxylesterase